MNVLFDLLPSKATIISPIIKPVNPPANAPVIPFIKFVIPCAVKKETFPLPVPMEKPIAAPITGVIPMIQPFARGFALLNVDSDFLVSA